MKITHKKCERLASVMTLGEGWGRPLFSDGHLMADDIDEDKLIIIVEFSFFA